MSPISLSPTSYPDVNEILNILFTNIQEILPDQFIGMYLFGSLANGGFDQHSDIDVLVVTDTEITSDVFSALKKMHERIAKIDSPWAVQLEVSYIPKHALRRFDPADKLPTRGAVDEAGRTASLQTIGNLRRSTGMFGAGYLEMLARQMTEEEDYFYERKVREWTS